MRTYLPYEHFNVVISTARTLIGADVSKFKVSYSPVMDMDNITVVSGSTTEVEKTITTPHTATGVSTPNTRTYINVQSGHTIEAGDVVQYATGKFGYVLSVDADTLMMKRPIKAAVADGATITQVGKMGDYVTPNISISEVGEYSITIEAPEYNIITQSRIKISEEQQTSSSSDETISIAY